MHIKKNTNLPLKPPKKGFIIIFSTVNVFRGSAIFYNFHTLSLFLSAITKKLKGLTKNHFYSAVKKQENLDPSIHLFILNYQTELLI